MALLQTHETCPTCGWEGLSDSPCRNPECDYVFPKNALQVFGDPVSDVGSATSDAARDVSRSVGQLGSTTAGAVGGMLGRPTANVVGGIGSAFSQGFGPGFAALFGALLGLLGGSMVIAHFCSTILWTAIFHLCGGVLIGPAIGLYVGLVVAMFLRDRLRVPSIVTVAALAAGTYFLGAAWWSALSLWWARTPFW